MTGHEALAIVRGALELTRAGAPMAGAEPRERNLIAEAFGALALLERIVTSHEHLTRMAGAEDRIGLQAIYGATTRQPLVQVVWGNRTAMWTVEEARRHALTVMEAAEAAVADGFLTEFLQKSGKLGWEEIAGIVTTFREWRNRKRL